MLKIQMSVDEDNKGQIEIGNSESALAIEVTTTLAIDRLIDQLLEMKMAMEIGEDFRQFEQNEEMH